jgi:hypothetical protein
MLSSHAQSSTVVHPILARSHGEFTAEPTAPGQRLGHFVVGQVPAGILEQRERYSRVNRVLRVRPGHSLVLQKIRKKKKLTGSEQKRIFVSNFIDTNSIY